MAEEGLYFHDEFAGLAGGGAGDDDEGFGGGEGEVEGADGGDGGLAPLAGAIDDEIGVGIDEHGGLGGVGLEVELGDGELEGVGVDGGECGRFLGFRGFGGPRCRDADDRSRVCLTVSSICPFPLSG